MASDDHPIRIVSPDYKPSGQGELELWLQKEGAELMESRAAQARGKLEDNENTSTAQYSDLYDNPEGRQGGASINANWGEEPHMALGRQEPFHQNDATYDESLKERRGVVGRAFSSFEEAKRVDQALVAANLEHARSGDFTTRSVLLQPKTKEGAASLASRVGKLVQP